MLKMAAVSLNDSLSSHMRRRTFNLKAGIVTEFLGETFRPVDFVQIRPPTHLMVVYCVFIAQGPRANTPIDIGPDNL